jgi:hypothetical protein
MSTTPAPTIMETPSPSSCGNASVELHHSGGGQFVQVIPQPNCEQHSDSPNDAIEQFDDEPPPPPPPVVFWWLWVGQAVD